MAVFGTSVDSRADEITLEIAMNDSVDSFPPRIYQNLITRENAIPTFQNSRVARFDCK